MPTIYYISREELIFVEYWLWHPVGFYITRRLPSPFPGVSFFFSSPLCKQKHFYVKKKFYSVTLSSLCYFTLFLSVCCWPWRNLICFYLWTRFLKCQFYRRIFHQGIKRGKHQFCHLFIPHIMINKSLQKESISKTMSNHSQKSSQCFWPSFWVSCSF